MAPVVKKIVSTPKPAVKNSKYRVGKRPARGFHRFRNGMLNVNPKGGEKELYVPEWADRSCPSSKVIANDYDSVKSNQRSPLLRLPAEIRNQIWRYVVGCATLKAVWVKIGRDQHRRFIPSNTPGITNLDILRCCLQIYAEAALLPYSLNTFTFYDYDRIEHDFKLLKPYQRTAVTHIQLEVRLVSGLKRKFGTLELLARLSGYSLGFLSALKQIRVLVFLRSIRNPDEVMTKMKEQLGVLLASRDLQIVFELSDQYWHDYIEP